MKVGVLQGDFVISLDDAGCQETKLILSTAYNVIPIWLRIANDHVLSAKAASEALKQKWDDNADNQKQLLMLELAPSMQVIVSCGIAFDALYDMLRPYANISTEDIDKWKEKRTSRGAQITTIIQRVYKLKNETLKQFKKGITEIIKYRDMAVHPSSELRNACSRSDIPVGVDWKFSAYRFSNAATCFQSTMKMFIYLYETKCKEDSINKDMENIFLSLQELGVVSLKS